MKANIEVTLETGDRLVWDSDDPKVNIGQQIRHAACCRQRPSPCQTVHRELVGEPRLTISAKGDGGWALPEQAS